MCITGYWHVRKLSRSEIVSLAEPVPSGPSSQYLLSLSSKLNLTIGAGLIESDDGGHLYNSYVVAMPDGKIACHRKLHCFVSEHMDSGNEYTVFDIPQGARVAILICYDNNIIEKRPDFRTERRRNSTGSPSDRRLPYPKPTLHGKN